MEHLQVKAASRTTLARYEGRPSSRRRGRHLRHRVLLKLSNILWLTEPLSLSELTDKCCHLSSTEPPCGRSESCTPAGPGPSASARVGHDGQALFGAGRSRLQQGLKLGLVDAAFPLQLDGGPLGRIPASHGLHWRLPGSGGPDQTSGDSIARSPHPDDMKCRDSWHTPGAGQRSTRRHPRRPAARAPPTRRPPGRGWRPLVRRAETTTPSTAAVEDGGRRGSSSGWRSRCAIT